MMIQLITDTKKAIPSFNGDLPRWYQADGAVLVPLLKKYHGKRVEVWNDIFGGFLPANALDIISMVMNPGIEGAIYVFSLTEECLSITGHNQEKLH